MYSTQLFLHSLNGILFGMSFYLHIIALKDLRPHRRLDGLKKAFLGLLITGMSLSGIFIYLQADWVVNEHNMNVGETTSWAWLVFDYLLAVYLCISAYLLRGLAIWKEKHRKHLLL